MDEHRILLRDIEIPDIEGLEVYVRRGGYEGAARAVEGMTPEQVIAVVDAAGLRCRGGTWAAAAGQWRPVADHADPCRYLCVNAAETDPGLFRDRKLAERLPHRLVEGTIIAARAVGARVAYICQRSDLRRAWESLDRAVGEAYEAGWLGRDIRGSGWDLDIHLHPTGGAALAGAESRLLAVLEGRRAEPLAADGSGPPSLLYGHPAVVQDAGTLGYLPGILADGGAAFRQVGTEAYPGTCVFCVSGHVRRPGLYELPLAVGSLGQFLDECAGGVRPGHRLKSVLPGGYGAPPLVPAQLDVALDPGAWAVPAGGAFPGVFGNGGIIAMDDTTCMVDTAIHLMRYFAAASCGRCAPGAEGADWVLEVLEHLEAGAGSAADVDLILDLAAQVAPPLERAAATALCGFGVAWAWTIHGLASHFRDEFEAHAAAAGCPVSRDDAIKVPDSVNIRF